MGSAGNGKCLRLQMARTDLPLIPQVFEASCGLTGPAEAKEGRGHREEMQLAVNML